MEELVQICDENEIKAAQNSLDAELIHWKDGNKIICREWIKSLLGEISQIAEKADMKHLLGPIYRVLDEGNQSIKWINEFKNGSSIEEIMQRSISDMIKKEK